MWKYKGVVIPAHFPKENHWLFIVVSVVNFCLSIYDSICSFQSRYRTIINTIKTPIFIFRKTRNFLARQHGKKKPTKCPKQKNEKDIGLFTCLLAKNLMLTKNAEVIEWDDIFRSEMASDLFNLSTTENKVNDLPVNQQWIVQNGFQALPNEVPKLNLTGK